MAGEVILRLHKDGMRTGQVGHALTFTGHQGGHVQRGGRPALRVPAEALEGLVVFRELHGGITVVLGVVVVIDALHLPIGESGVNHLGFHFVHCGQGTVLLQVEEGGCTAQGIEAREDIGGVKVGHHLRSPDLVEGAGGLLHGDEGVGQQVGTLHAFLPDNHVHAVGGILAVAFVVENGVLVQAGQGVQVCVIEGIGGHLHVVAEHAHVAGPPDEIDLGGIRRRRKGVHGRRHFLRLLLRLFFRLRFRLHRLAGLLPGPFLPLLADGAGGFRRGQLGVVPGGFGSSLGCRLGGLLAVFHHRISGDVFQAGPGIGHPGVGDITAADGAGKEDIGPYVHGVPVFFLLRDGHDGGVAGHPDLGKGVRIFHLSGQAEDIAGGVHDFHVPQHDHVLGNAGIVEGVAPDFLVFREGMHLAAEEEQLAGAVVPAVVGAQHLLVLPHVRAVAKIGGGKVAAVFQAGSLDEGGVQVHVHLVVEHEEVGLGVIGSVEAFDNLAVLVPHGAAAGENGHGVLGVVVQVTGAEGVVVRVFQLHQVSAELGHVVVHHVLQGVGRQLGVLLDNLHMAGGVDNVGLDIPEGRVAEEIGVVVQEFGGAHHLAEALSVLLDELGALGAQEVNLLIVGGVLGTGGISQSRHCERQ